jgi:hypothetical protein
VARSERTPGRWHAFQAPGADRPLCRRPPPGEGKKERGAVSARLTVPIAGRHCAISAFGKVRRTASPYLPRFPSLEVCVRRPPVCAAPPSWGRHPQTFTKADLKPVSAARGSAHVAGRACGGSETASRCLLWTRCTLSPTGSGFQDFSRGWLWPALSRPSSPASPRR